jgi:hypothetical protein
LFDNDCHTFSRANCYLNENSELEEMRKALEDAHVFYNSVFCASKVFNFNQTSITKVSDDSVVDSTDRLFYIE